MLSAKIIGEGLTFDGVLLVPAKSDVLPRDIDVSTYLIPAIKLNMPLMSAGLRESHPQDVTITKESPNYSL